MNKPSFTPWTTRQTVHGLTVRTKRTQHRKRRGLRHPGLVQASPKTTKPANSNGRRLVTMKNAISLASIG